MKSLEAHHVCVHCGYPTTRLYRLLAGKHIKLVECKNCHRDVDPYIEREMLLILIDWILLRPSAYKHIIFNRSTNIPRSWIVILLFTFPIFLRFARDIEATNDPLTLHKGMILHAFQSVFLELTILVLVSGVSTFILLWIHHLRVPHANETVSSRKMNTVTHILRSILIAILVPYLLFSAVTCFVYIYEPSATIRHLGSLFIYASQFIGVQCIMTCLRIKPK